MSEALPTPDRASEPVPDPVAPPVRAGVLHEELSDDDRERIASELLFEATVPPPEPADPWAHRRGEPRVFAFFWTLYVLLAVAGSVTWVARFAPVTAGSYAPAARIMLVVVAIGATVLWPMTRLCQASPGRGAVRHVLADAAVLLIPLQMILWPLIFLASWPARTVAALAALCVVWIMLIGGILAHALSERIEAPRDPALLGRSLWMVMIILIVLAAPIALAGIGPRFSAPEWLPMLSPLSAINDITGRGMSGPQKPVTGMQWRLIFATGAVAIAVWMLCGVRAEAVNRKNAA